MELWIPYGETEVAVRVPDDNFYRILEPAKPLGTKDAPSIIEEALETPIGGVFLKDMIKPGSVAGIVIDPIVPPIARDEAAKALRSRLTALGIDNVRVFMRKRMSNVASTGDNLKIIVPPLLMAPRTLETTLIAW